MVANMASLPSTVMLVAGAMWGRGRGGGACACAAPVHRTSETNPILTFLKCLKIIWSCRTRQSATLVGTVWPAHESWMAVSPVDTDIHESRCRSLLSMYRRSPRESRMWGFPNVRESQLLL